jgi:hypothetical protein
LIRLRAPNLKLKEQKVVVEDMIINTLWPTAEAKFAIRTDKRGMQQEGLKITFISCEKEKHLYQNQNV